MGDVRVPGWLLGGLALVSVASLAGVSFLLGRESVRQPAPPTPVQVVVTSAPALTAPPTVVAAQPPQTPTVPPVEKPNATATLTPQAPVAQAPAVTSTAAVSASAAPHPKPHAVKHAAAPDAAPVAAYLKAVDAISPGKLTDDPDRFANELVQGALNGDFSSLNKLVAEAEQTRRRLHALKPPPPCKTYHEHSVALVDDSVRVLKTMASALKTSDPGALQAMAGDAQALQTRAEALKNEEAALKERYGL